MIELKLPELGENIETAEISRLLVKEGDDVQAGQNVMELESEKASFPLPCPQGGRVGKILVQAGDSVSVGQALLQIEESNGKPSNDRAKASPEKAKSAPPGQDKEQDAKPKPTEQGEPKKPAGEAKAKSAPPEHEKEQDADHAQEKKTTEPGDPKKASAEPKTAAAPAFPHQVAAGPATRRLARELGVDLADVNGSASHGRVTRDDLKAFVKARLTRTAQPSSPEHTPALPDFSRFGPITRKPLSKIARTAVGRLTLAWRTIPHVTQHDVAEITELEASRRRYNEDHPDGAKITMTALAVLASVAALKAYPQVNSSYDPAAEELILKDYYHIGIAVDTEHGLLVPVLRDANRKNLATLATELTALAERARQRSLTPAEMEGGTFTITNLGGIGGSFFTPIINYPEVAILGLGRAEDSAGKLRLPLSLSYDHRVINGADAARFLIKIAALLTDPIRLLAEWPA